MALFLSFVILSLSLWVVKLSRGYSTYAGISKQARKAYSADVVPFIAEGLFTFGVKSSTKKEGCMIRVLFL